MSIVARVASLYDRVMLSKPWLAVAVLACILGAISYQARDFRLDASADSLILEHDEDLKHFRMISDRYGSTEFVLLTYRPLSGDLLARDTLERIRSLKHELEALPRTDTVLTVLDVPLLRSPPAPLNKLEENARTLLEEGVDMALARQEIATSPVFQNLLVSPDLGVTGIYAILIPDAELNRLLALRMPLLEKEAEGALTPGEKRELVRLTERYERRQDEVNRVRHKDIAAIRSIMDGYREHAELFLGGVPMIADDMISYIRNDLKVFGAGMLCFLVVTLGVIFRRKRWVFLPMMCCALSATTTMGLLALFGWEVTVISSNFVSLQLVLTMAVTIHLIVRYNELLGADPEAEARTLVLGTVRSMLKPCFYTSITTIAGFCSLLLCDILPVVNFGWMMTVGIVVSLVVTFLLFPAALMCMPKAKAGPEHQFGAPLTAFFARFTRDHPRIIWTATAVVIAATAIGIARLTVENCFINYFRKSTEIYQGMKLIDQRLGGTTPLDITIDFPEEDAPRDTAAPPPDVAPAAPSEDDVFSDFAEFEEPAATDGDTYWFTPKRMDTIRRVHEYIDGFEATGKVMSLRTLLNLVESINNGEQLDSFDLALLFNKLPEQFMSVLVDPYVSVANNQARLNVRIKDSMPGLRRNALLEQMNRELAEKVGLAPGQYRLGGVMVLYNNMLQSLFASQIKTIGFTVLALMVMFMVLFRSLRIALIAILPNVLASITVLGAMGLLGIPLDMMTITIVAISIGIAVDDTIHYIHRFGHEFEKDRHYMSTMFRCHGTIGNAMYYTSITITVGFSILAFSNFIPTVLFGMLTAVAMVMALLGALTLLPRLIIFLRPFGPEPPHPDAAP